MSYPEACTVASILVGQGYFCSVVENGINTGQYSVVVSGVKR